MNDHTSDPNRALIRFALAVLNQWHGGERGGIDGYELQDLAVWAGVCVRETRTAPCDDVCPCADVIGWDAEVQCVLIRAGVFALMRAAEHGELRHRAGREG